MLNSQAQKTLYGLMDMIYPVGSYYITESSDLNTAAKMTTKFGGTWVQLDAGRFLEAVTSGAGSNKNAGLPNIKGTIGSSKGVVFRATTATDVTKTGAFSGTGDWIDSGKVGSGNYDIRYTNIDFKASNSSSVYSDSVSTVQPKSRTVYIYRRTALAGGGIELVISLLNSILEGGRKYAKR